MSTETATATVTTTMSTPTGSKCPAAELLPIRMVSKVVRGFGRGSTDLGIPTANLDRDLLKSSCPFDELPTGIYWGYCRIGEKKEDMNGNENKNNNNNDNDDQPKDQYSDPTGIVFKAAISIGYNPTYGNEEKTVEPHLIADETDPRRHASCTGETLLQDFYEQSIRLAVVGYLRPELPFEGLEKLVEAIKNDISNTVKLGETQEELPCAEKAWVGSDEPL